MLIPRVMEMCSFDLRQFLLFLKEGLLNKTLYQSVVMVMFVRVILGQLLKTRMRLSLARAAAERETRKAAVLLWGSRLSSNSQVWGSGCCVSS